MTESRVAGIVRDLIASFESVVRKHEITHAEYRAAIAFIDEAIEKGERSLLPDAFLESIVVANEATRQQGTESQVLGPYHLPDAAWIEDGRLAGDDEPGEHVTMTGTVRGVEGEPIAGAVLDFWQADAAGRYSGFDPAAKPGNLRGRLRSGPDGSYALHTVLPAPYQIPHQGPTGRLLAELGRHPWRPAHVHVIASHEGRRPLTTQVYFEGDAYLDSDAVGASRPELVFPVEETADGKRVVFDIALEPA